MDRTCRWLFAISWFWFALTPAWGFEDLPEGPGLASKYPGDRGIEDDPAVLLAEDFEAGALVEILDRWDSFSNEGGQVLEFSDDVPFPDLREGGRSLRMTARPGENTGGHLYSRLPEEVDRAFARFYVKFPEPSHYIHHFVHFGGYNPATPYPQGGAGSRPRGDDRITVGIEPFGRSGRVPPPGDWNFYAYWHEMKASAGGRFWGNALQPVERQPVPSGRWQCVEVMIQLNTPGESDGALALWLDGALVSHIRRGTPRGPWTGLGFETLAEGGEPFEGFDFRTVEDLKLNFFWLLHYVTPENQRRNRVEDPSRPSIVLFDHVVVAKEYIGPVEPSEPSD